MDAVMGGPALAWSHSSGACAFGVRWQGSDALSYIFPPLSSSFLLSLSFSGAALDENQPFSTDRR